MNIFTLRLCIQQFNIIYFINYTHIVGKLAIKIFAMEEIVERIDWNWTLKQWEGMRKSKREEVAWRIGR